MSSESENISVERETPTRWSRSGSNPGDLRATRNLRNAMDIPSVAARHQRIALRQLRHARLGGAEVQAAPPQEVGPQSEAGLPSPDGLALGPVGEGDTPASRMAVFQRHTMASERIAEAIAMSSISPALNSLAQLGQGALGARHTAGVANRNGDLFPSERSWRNLLDSMRGGTTTGISEREMAERRRDDGVLRELLSTVTSPADRIAATFVPSLQIEEPEQSPSLDRACAALLEAFDKTKKNPQRSLAISAFENWKSGKPTSVSFLGHPICSLFEIIGEYTIQEIIDRALKIEESGLYRFIKLLLEEKYKDVEDVDRFSVQVSMASRTSENSFFMGPGDLIMIKPLHGALWAGDGDLYTCTSPVVEENPSTNIMSAPIKVSNYTLHNDGPGGRIGVFCVFLINGDIANGKRSCALIEKNIIHKVSDSCSRKVHGVDGFFNIVKRTLIPTPVARTIDSSAMASILMAGEMNKPDYSMGKVAKTALMLSGEEVEVHLRPSRWDDPVFIGHGQALFRVGSGDEGVVLRGTLKGTLPALNLAASSSSQVEIRHHLILSTTENIEDIIKSNELINIESGQDTRDLIAQMPVAPLIIRANDTVSIMRANQKKEEVIGRQIEL